MPSNESRDRQASTGRTGDSEQCGPALVRAEARGSADGSSQTIMPSSESRDRQTSVRMAGRAGESGGTRQRRRELSNSYAINELKTVKHPPRELGTASSAGQALARAEARGSADESSQTIMPSGESRDHQASAGMAGEALARAEARGSTNTGCWRIRPTDESRPSSINQ